MQKQGRSLKSRALHKRKYRDADKDGAYSLVVERWTTVLFAIWPQEFTRSQGSQLSTPFEKFIIDGLSGGLENFAKYINECARFLYSPGPRDESMLNFCKNCITGGKV